MFGRKQKEKEMKKEKVFVDLQDYSSPMFAPSDARVKVIEVTSFRDMKALNDFAYRGNILVMDFSLFAEGDNVKREMAKNLMEIARDISGAFVEVSDRLMVLSPSGLNIDKCRITHKEN